MAKSHIEDFDLSAVLKHHVKKHKAKPVQFGSVSAGVLHRLEKKQQYRKSSRLSAFDSIRNITTVNSKIDEQSEKLNEAQIKVERRRLQLEKWKEEKAKKKKEMTALKKKPFVAGVPQKPIAVLLPSPVLKPKNTNRRVTRAQAAKSTNKPEEKKTLNKPQSFAPKNAQFKAPLLKSQIKLPTIAEPSHKTKISLINFDPILPNTTSATKQTRSQTVKLKGNNKSAGKIIDTKPVNDKTSVKSDKNNKPKSNSKPFNQKITFTMPTISSSSSSESEPKVPSKQSRPNRTAVAAKQQTKQKPSTGLLPSEANEHTATKNTRHVRQRKTPKVLTRQNAILLSERTDTDSSSDEPKNNRNSSSDELMLIEGTNIVKQGKLDTDSSIEELMSKKENVTNQTTPVSQVPRSESNSEEKLRSPKILNMTPEQIQEEVKAMSPCVTVSRGKDNARRELLQKMAQDEFEEYTNKVESVKHFRHQLDSEIKRMTDLCETWEKSMKNSEEQGLPLPETAQELVLAATGQARLLMRSKLQQFSKLLERCEHGAPGMQPVTPADLHGFWDMLFMQIENVDMRFNSLDELKSRNWIEETEVEKKKPTKGANVAAKRPGKPARGASQLRQMIAAARKAKKVTESSDSEGSQPAESKTFEAGFFSVTSPVKSPVVCTPNKANLLKTVLSSEAKKALTSMWSPHVVVMASQRARQVELESCVEGVAPLPLTPIQTPLNLDATPGRSILKSGNIETGKKSRKTVIFEDSDLENSIHNKSDNGKTNSKRKSLSKSAKSALKATLFDDSDIEISTHNKSDDGNTSSKKKSSSNNKSDTRKSNSKRKSSSKSAKKNIKATLFDDSDIENTENNDKTEGSELDIQRKSFSRLEAESEILSNISPVMTRSRRASMINKTATSCSKAATEGFTPRSSRRNKMK